MDAFSALIVQCLAAFPLFEAQYAIPLAILIGFLAAYAFLPGIIGNLLRIIRFLQAMGPVPDWSHEQSSLTDRFFSWIFTRSMREEDLVNRWGAFAPFLFVAVPSPMTGSWTGCAMASVFDAEFKGAFAAISLCTVVAVLITAFPMPGLLKIFGDVS